MRDEIVKKKIFTMLEDCSEQLSKYKELRNRGMSRDPVFEAILDMRKQTINEILDIITK